ncbi:hypothetical protein AeNC1_013497 [Aphanomyces euteiches]|nr:hypothetical protein AeNC1_013497 [Aphanomyces euteiches]
MALVESAPLRFNSSKIDRRDYHSNGFLASVVCLGGADHVVNHAGDIFKQVWPLGSHKSTTSWSSRISLDISTLFKPQGKICAINANEADLPFQKLFFQSITFVWENIITRPIGGSQRTLAHFEGSDHAKRFQSNVGQELGAINAGNLRKAHAALEDGHVKGWNALTGFE